MSQYQPTYVPLLCFLTSPHFGGSALFGQSLQLALHFILLQLGYMFPTFPTSPVLFTSYVLQFSFVLLSCPHYILYSLRSLSIFPHLFSFPLGHCFSFMHPFLSKPIDFFPRPTFNKPE